MTAEGSAGRGVTPWPIFLVDDDRDFLELERRILESQRLPGGLFLGPAGRAGRAAAPRSRSDAPGARGDRPDDERPGFRVHLCPRREERPRLAGIPVIIVSAVSSQKGFDFQPAHRRGPGGDERRRVLRQAGARRRRFLAKVKELLR